MAPHLEKLNRKLLDVAAGRIKRLMVFEPPRHGKSMLISQYFPAWYLGTFPDRWAILCSYEAQIAASWGRKARDVLVEYGPDLFGVKVKRDVQGAQWWEIEGHVGGMVTAGIGGPITGKGADLLVIDDPVKNAAEARSKTIRDSHWDWFQAVAYPRLEPGGVIILIMTRWHEDDLGGRLEAEMQQGGEQWEILRLPAIAEENDQLIPPRKPGEALWPWRYDEEELANIRRAVGEYVWNAEYQQRPLPPQGYMVSREAFEVIGEVPAGMRFVRYWDKAATAPSVGKDPDWTVGCKMGMNNGVYYIVDVARMRGTPGQVEQCIKQTAMLDGKPVAIVMEQEPGASGVSDIDYYQRQVLNSFNFHGIPVSGSKEVRAAPFLSQAEAGNVKLLNGSWIKDFLDEVVAFPMGTHDDIVDASAGSFEALNSRIGTFRKFLKV